MTNLAMTAADLSLRLAEEAEVLTIEAQGHERAGRRDKAFRLLGKAEGLVLASQRIGAVVREATG
jgi:hypothetical protein